VDRVSFVAPKRSGELDLKDIWLFSACSASQLRAVRRAVDAVTAREGAVLVEEGTIGREFFFIVDGVASVRRKGRKIATLGPGRYFGELALLDRKPRSASVIAETDMKLLVLEQRAFNGLLEAAPGLSHKLLVAMSQRLRDADSKAFT
jgi:CRP/FNR family transcriptional regulator, cyclic AMP receptor protein